MDNNNVQKPESDNSVVQPDNNDVLDVEAILDGEITIDSTETNQNSSTGGRIEHGEVQSDPAPKTKLEVLPKPKRKNLGGRPVKISKLSDLQSKIDSYFSDEKNKPFCMSGLAYHLGLSRQGLIEYRNKNKQFSDAIKKARDRIEVEVEQMLMSGKHPGGIIFNLCNNFKWVQPSQKIESKNENINNTTIHSALTDEELEKRLLIFDSQKQKQA